MSAIAQGKKIIAEARRIPKEVKKITYRELLPGDEFWVVRERDDFSLLKLQKIWWFEVLEIIPESGLAKVSVIFPQTGHKEVAYFETASVGGYLKVYFDLEKNGYCFDNNIVAIVVL